MSIPGARSGGLAEVGDTVATFSSYEAAQKAVSTLIAGDVPAKDIAIVGRGLRSIEKITGRLGYAVAARSGAINGLLLGLLFAAVFVLGTPDAAIQLFVGVMFVGIALGMLMSIIAYSFVRRRRDYASVTQVVADSYDVTVLSGSIHRAREALGRRGADTAVPARPSHPTPPLANPTPAPAPEPDSTEPPRYGERTSTVIEPPRYGERIEPGVGTTPAPAPEDDVAPDDTASDDAPEQPRA